MDLKNYNITLGELMKYEKAAMLLKTEFPEWANSPLVRMASGMALSKVLTVAQKRVPEERLLKIVKQLESL